MPDSRATLAISLAAVLCLSACATPSAPASSAPTPSSPEVSASPVADETPVPTPFVDAACADILDETAVALLFTAPVTLQSRVTSRQLSSNIGPISSGLRQSGGIECEWSNGEPSELESQTRNPAYVGGILRVLPDAEAAWQVWASYYTVSDTRSDGCGDNTSPGCTINALDGSTWAELDLSGVIDSSAGGAAMDTVLAAVGSAAPSTEAWSPPEGTVPLDASCTQFFSAAEVRSVLDIDAEIFLDGRDGGDSILNRSWVAVGAGSCPWIEDEGMGLGGTHAWLPGGEWAWEVERESRARQPKQLAVPGLQDDDEAFLDCASADLPCTVDLIVGHNWIQIRLEPETLRDFTPADPLTVAKSLATMTVAAVRG